MNKDELVTLVLLSIIATFAYIKLQQNAHKAQPEPTYQAPWVIHADLAGR